MKKDFDYFGCFSAVGKIAAQSADYLHTSAKSFDADKIDDYTVVMHQFENDADTKKHELCKRLAHEFMPPIAREDITLLSQELDNVVDAVEDVMRKIYMFNIPKISEEAIEFTLLVSQVCDVLYKLLLEFSNFKKSKEIENYIIEINTLENKGDSMYSEFIRNLFSGDAPIESRLPWVMVYESLETSIDACEHVADVIDSIITKNT